MNFQDDDLDLGYTPSIVSNSRSAGMKKIGRKPDNKNNGAKQKKQEDFDFLDELLSPAKPIQKKENVKKSNPNPNFEKDDVDSFFDQPSLSFNATNKSNTTARPLTAKITTPVVEDTIVEEVTEQKPISNFKFKRPETAVTTKKDPTEDETNISISPSQRMMKPPIRKRESKDENLSKSGAGGLILPEEPPKLSVTVKEEENKFNPVPKLNKKRSSIELQVGDFNLNNPIKKEQFALKLQPSNKLEPSPSTKLEPKLQPKLEQAPPKYESTKLWDPQNSYTIEDKNLTLKYDKKDSNQLEFIKKNYQRHIEQLQKSLEDQIKSNKQSRERLMKESNEIIEGERKRLQNIHKQQIERVKQMNQWQRKKMEEGYKMQIQLLKEHNQRLMANENKMPSSSFHNGVDRKEIEYLQQKLKNQRLSLEQREKMLAHRQYNLEERERQFNKSRRLEQQKLRDYEKRVMQLQMESKKSIANLKKQIEEEKQSMAVEMASLQMANYKKNEKIENLFSELELERRELEKEKYQIRKLNNEVISDLKSKQEEVKMGKERNMRVQSDLVSKLRVIEAHSANVSANNANMKENSWVNGERGSISKEKVEQFKRVENTQNRFMNLTSQLSGHFAHRSSGFDLSKYLMSMGKYTRTRGSVV